MFSVFSSQDKRHFLVALSCALVIHVVAFLIIQLSDAGRPRATPYNPPVYVELNAPTEAITTTPATPEATRSATPSRATAQQTPKAPPVPPRSNAAARSPQPASGQASNAAAAQSSSSGTASAAGASSPTTSGDFSSSRASDASTTSPGTSARPGLTYSGGGAGTYTAPVDAPVVAGSTSVSGASGGQPAASDSRVNVGPAVVADRASSGDSSEGASGRASGGSVILPDAAKGPIPASVSALQQNEKALRDWLSKYAGQSTSSVANGTAVEGSSGRSNDGTRTAGTVNGTSSSNAAVAAEVRERLNQIEAALSNQSGPGTSVAQASSGGTGAESGSGNSGPANGPGSSPAAGYTDPGISWSRQGYTERYLVSSDKLSLDQSLVNAILRQFPNHPPKITVDVRFDVLANGFVTNLNLVQSSGYTRVDQLIESLFQGRVFVQSPGTPTMTGEKTYVLIETSAAR